MAWVKVDEGFPDHPKVIGLGLAAKGLWLVGLCYASRHMTDGRLPEGLVTTQGAAATDAAADLVAAGLWESCERGWLIHDYAEHQRTRQQIEATSEARSVAGRRGGRPAESQPKANGKQNESKTEANRKPAESHGEANPKQIQNKNKNTEREERTTADAGADAPPRSEPYAVFLALCEETGADEEAASRSFKSQQLGIAKRLVDDGFAESDVRECVRYLKSQTWRTGIIDLRTVQAEIGRWSLAGRPAAEPIPIRPGIATGKTRDQESRDALETFLAIANGAPL